MGDKLFLSFIAGYVLFVISFLILTLVHYYGVLGVVLFFSGIALFMGTGYLIVKLAGGFE